MRNRRVSFAAGFTLVELVIVVAIVLFIMAIGYPLLHNLIIRGKLEGAVCEIAMLLQQAKLEAIKRSVPTVIRVDTAGREIISFADVNGPSLTDPPDGIYNPVAGQPEHGTDYPIRPALKLAKGTDFQAPLAEPVVEGFTTVGSEQVAIFQSDSSMQDDNAIRIANGRSNFLEVRVAPKATARVELRKWNGSAFQAAFGEGGVQWQWY